MTTHRPIAARLVVLVLSMLLVCACNKAKESDPTEATKTPRKEVVPPETDPGRLTIQIFKSYQKEVVGLLKAALAGGGTAAAVEVCKGVSKQIIERFESLPGTKVRRVAMRHRNPAAAPDEFEKGVFAEWEAAKAAGQMPTAIARQTDDGFRVMQPIMLGARLCLRCHGTRRDMTQDTMDMIDRMYPEDNARDFKMGDVRGAFSAILAKP